MFLLFSELTELREAQDALFAVPESVRSSYSQSNAGDDDDDCSQSVLSDASSQISSRELHDGTTPVVHPPLGSSIRSKDLSSLDIVHEEDSDQYNFNHHHQQQSHHKEWQPQKHLPPVIEHGGNEVEELDELLTSSATNDPLRKSLGKLDDDSVYSDFDAETGIQAPSIKMCMTVKDSAIEREFDTEQLHDVEYGETNGASPFDEEGEMTLKDLLETPTQIEREDDSYCPIDDSARLDDNTSSSKKSKRKTPKLSFSTKNSFLSRKVNSSSKKIRRRNKRVYKFCVWNCRRITISVTLVICILIGISVISWWGAGKATMGSDDANKDDGKIEDQQNAAINTDRASSLVPTSSNFPTQLPSLSPSLRGSTNSDGMGGGLSPLLNVSTANATSLHPSSAPSTSLSPSSISQNNSSLNTSYYSIMPSPGPSSNTSNINESLKPPNNETSDYSEVPSSFPSSSPSINASIDAPIVNPNITISNNQSSLIIDDVPLAYESNQIVFGSQLEHAGSSVAMSPNSNVIVVGFKEANSPSNDKTGLVRVYKRNDGDTNNSYTPLGQDSMFGRASEDELGAAVSISNDGMRVVVGSRSFSSSSDKQKNGEVTIFQYSNISDSWTQMGSSIQGDAEKDRLGWSVSMSGDGNRVAVGSPRANGGTGSVTIYEYNSTEWGLLASVNGDENGDRAGFSTSLSNDGSTIAIGAFTSSLEGLINSGRVDIYQLVEQGSSDESPSLVKQGQTIVGSTAGSQLGYSVAISGDGTRIGIGSNGYSTSNITRAGLCEVYEFQEQSWSKTGYLIGEEENEETGLHVAISSSGNHVSCSKNTYDGQGAVTILEEGREGWKVKDTVTSSLDDAASFGVAVSLSQYGNTIVAGAPLFNSSAGAFEVFSAKEE